MFIKNWKNIVILGVICINCFSLTGCYLAAATVVATTAGSTIADERSVGKIVDDKVIMLKIKDKYTKHDVNNILCRVSVNVSEGRVMLTGNIADHDSILEAIKLAWEVEGVREVINEIETGEKNLSRRAKDSMIATQIRAKFMLRENFRSINYTVDVNNGVVYLLGIAQNKKEMQSAEEMASTVSGVLKVVNHTVLKVDSRRTR